MKKQKSSCFLIPYTIITKKIQESNTLRQDNKVYIFSSLVHKIVYNILNGNQNNLDIIANFQKPWSSHEDLCPGLTIPSSPLHIACEPGPPLRDTCLTIPSSPLHSICESGPPLRDSLASPA